MLVKDIRGKVDSLHDLLQNEDQKFIKQGIEALLRHAVSQATRSADLLAMEKLLERETKSWTGFEDNAVKTALKLKQRRLVFDIEEGVSASSARSSNSTLSASTTPSETVGTNSPSRMSYHVKQRSRGPLEWRLLLRSDSSSRQGELREIAIYDDAPVFVEWKMIERGLELKLKHRIKSLAGLLQEMDSSTFHSLSYMGYLRDQALGYYGYVFRTPGRSVKDYTTLAQVLAGDTTVPSLNDRFSLATALAETVLQLHTSGWPHKGIRADNVLFFPNDGEDVNLTQAFLGGYEYARADNPSDMTESPEMHQETNLYRHPALLRANRAPFEKSFGLFAVGCVLVEIGLWKDITTILLQFCRNRKIGRSASPLLTGKKTGVYTGKDEMPEVNQARIGLLRENGKGSIREALKFAAGVSFAEVASLSLLAGDRHIAAEGDDVANEDQDNNDLCIGVEIDILDRLRRCKL